MRLTTKVAVATAMAVVTLAPAAGAQTPIPNIPSLDVARFQMTISGAQTTHFEFEWIPGDGCGRHAKAALAEQWNYKRGKAVVIVFTKIGPGTILIRRQGRAIGDAAFAAPGDVTRQAVGFFDMGPLLGCGGYHSLVAPDCGKTYKVQSEFHLFWAKGRLDLEKGGHRLFENPAGNCGQMDGVLNFDELPSAYPTLYKQRTRFTEKQMFGNNRGFRLDLKDRFIASADGHTWPGSTEGLKGETTLTFKRLH